MRLFEGCKMKIEFCVHAVGRRAMGPPRQEEGDGLASPSCIAWPRKLGPRAAGPHDSRAKQRCTSREQGEVGFARLLKRGPISRLSKRGRVQTAAPTMSSPGDAALASPDVAALKGRYAQELQQLFDIYAEKRDHINQDHAIQVLQDFGAIQQTQTDQNAAAQPKRPPGRLNSAIVQPPVVTIEDAQQAFNQTTSQTEQKLLANNFFDFLVRVTMAAPAPPAVPSRISGGQPREVSPARRVFTLLTSFRIGVPEEMKRRATDARAKRAAAATVASTCFATAQAKELPSRRSCHRHESHRG